MDTLLLDRTTPMDALFSFMGGAERVRVSREADRVVLTPASKIEKPDDVPYDGGSYFDENGKEIDPNDYPDTAAYLNAIPGYVDSLLEMENDPNTVWEDVPEECFHV